MFARRFAVAMCAACTALPISLAVDLPQAFSPAPNPVAEVSIPFLPQAHASETQTHIGKPARFRIPSVGVDAHVQHLGLLPDGKLDAPTNADDVGWYQLGPRPGETGNAVIDGHLTLGKDPGVFWDLHKVKPGDVITVQDDAGEQRDFRVVHSEIYDVDNAPMQRIFGKTDGRHLNLITCAGVWRKALGHYDKRLIVYSEAVADPQSS